MARQYPFSVLARPFDQLAEPSFLSRAGFLLIEKGEIAFIELLEKLLPRDLLELRVTLAEIEAKHAGIVLAAIPLHPRRSTAACLGPASDCLVIGGGLCARHRAAPVQSGAERQSAGVVPERFARTRVERKGSKMIMTRATVAAALRQL